MEPIGRLSVKEVRLDVHRSAREAICNRGAPLRPTGAPHGGRAESSGTPQCERGVP